MKALGATKGNNYYPSIINRVGLDTPLPIPAFINVPTQHYHSRTLSCHYKIVNKDYSIRGLRLHAFWLNGRGEILKESPTSKAGERTDLLVVPGSGKSKGEGLYACAIKVPGHSVIIQSIFAVYYTHKRETSVYVKRSVVLTRKGAVSCHEPEDVCVLRAVEGKTKEMMFKNITLRLLKHATKHVSTETYNTLINNPLGEYNKHVSKETYNTLINNPLGEYNKHVSTETYNTLINNPLGEYNKHVSTETYNTLINNPLGEYNKHVSTET